MSLLASIPSPGSGSIEIGPFELRAYGLMIGLGVLAAVWLGMKRWAERGGDPDLIASLAMWGVPAGLIGARIYHVVTDWRFDEGWAEPFRIWNGGLGIPGGMFAGILVGLWVVRSRGQSTSGVIDSVAPALPLAQAIGRFGNWFNQELFGGPTDLPWAVEIDRDHRPVGHVADATFHPTFLYESLWNIALMLFLMWIDRRRVLRPGALIAVYILGYGLGRLWIELVRIDFANEILGVRVNVWMSLFAIVSSAVWLVFWGRRSADADGGSVEHVEVTPPLDGAL
jgi:prolipoprotein diacylglyceryl transferase